MGDPRKYWKESIGVTRRRRRRPALPVEPATTGPVTGTVDPGDEDTATYATGPMATGPVSGPVTDPPSRQDPAHPLSPEALAALERALDSLPVGTLSFADEAARLLWRDPRPEDLVAISRIASDRHLLPPGPLRRAVLAALAVRAQAELLFRTFERQLPDAGIAAARASLAEKLAGRARELAETLVAREDDPGFELVGLARGLLPGPERLLGLARIARATGDLLADLREGIPLPRLAHAPERETMDLVAAIRDGNLRPRDELLLAILAMLVATEAHLARGERQELLGDRVALAELWNRVEAAVDRLNRKHDRDPEPLARLAAWRRSLREMRGRLDEFLTAPPTGPVTGPVTGPPAEPPGEPDPPAPSAAVPPALVQAEDAIREQLREVRQKVSSEGKERPRRRGGFLRWLLFGGTLAALGLGLALLLLPAPPPPPLPVDLEALRAGAPLLGADPAGRLLVAVVDPAWNTFPEEERRARATRLAALAEEQGFRAGILLAPAGVPVATWAPGRPPVLRGPLEPPAPGMAAASPVEPPETRASRWPRHGGGTYLGTDG